MSDFVRTEKVGTFQAHSLPWLTENKTLPLFLATFPGEKPLLVASAPDPGMNKLNEEFRHDVGNRFKRYDHLFTKGCAQTAHGRGANLIRPIKKPLPRFQGYGLMVMMEGHTPNAARIYCATTTATHLGRISLRRDDKIENRTPVVLKLITVDRNRQCNALRLLCDMTTREIRETYR